MESEIVCGYIPSNNMKDWMLRADGAHNWWYEPRATFYCTKHETGDSMHCNGADYDAAYRIVGKEPFYDLQAKKITDPRIFITHYPKKGEWEQLKTVSDLRQSPLFKR